MAGRNPQLLPSRPPPVSGLTTREQCHQDATLARQAAFMTQPRQTFDWTAWYAKIPGIPADWGFPKSAEPSTTRSEILLPPRRTPHLAR